MDENKKPEQQEQNTESATSEKRNQELSSKELDQVAGGEALSLNFTKIELTYAVQDSDGAEEKK